MALFNLPNQTKSKEKDKKIIKKSTTTKRTATKSNRLGDRIAAIQSVVLDKLGKYKDDYIIIQDTNSLNNYIEKCVENGIVAIDTETTGLDPLVDKCVGICLYTPNESACYIPINHINYITNERLDNQLTEQEVKPFMDMLVNTKIIMFNASFDIRVIKNQIGTRLPCYWDAYIASKILNENEKNGGLKPLHQKYVLDDKEDAFSFGELFDKLNFSLVPIQAAYIYAAHDAIITYELYEFQKQYLREDSQRDDIKDMYYVFRNIEMPVIDVVVDMEDRGVALDLEYTAKLSEKYNKLVTDSLNNVHNIINQEYANQIQLYKLNTPDHKLDDPINIDSPTQLAILYYDIIKVSPQDPKSPRGTGEPILKKLGDDLSKAILKYRGYKKLITTYIDKMPKAMNMEDHRIHCNFNQYGAQTGRFSSSNPNLQNIPSRNHDIRKMFKATDAIEEYQCEGNQYIIKNISQIEIEGKGWVFVKDIKEGDKIITNGDPDVIKKITIKNNLYYIEV